MHQYSTEVMRCLMCQVYQIGGKNQKFTGNNFWLQGYCASTVGLDEEMVKVYIRNQEVEGGRYDQMKPM